MAYNFCCDSYHVPNLIYIYYTIVIRVNYVTCAISWGRCSLIGLLVVMSVVVLLVLLLISFPVDGAGGEVFLVHLFFVVCYCFLFWITCVLSN